MSAAFSPDWGRAETVLSTLIDSAGSSPVVRGSPVSGYTCGRGDAGRAGG